MRGVLVEARGQADAIGKRDAHHRHRRRRGTRGATSWARPDSRRAVQAGKGQIVRGFRIEREQERAGERIELVHGLGRARVTRGREARASSDDTIGVRRSRARLVLSSLSYRALGSVSALLARRRWRDARSRRSRSRRIRAASYAQRADVRAFAAEVAAPTGLPHRAGRALARAARSSSRRSSRRWTGRCCVPPKWYEYAPPLAGARARGRRRRVLARATRQRSRARKPNTACPPKSSSRSWASKRSTAATRVSIACSTRWPRSPSITRAARRSFAASCANTCCSRTSRAGRRSCPPARSPARWACRSSCPAAIASTRSISTATASIDLWHDNADVIGSVANYLARHDWLRGQPVLLPARIAPEARDAALRRLDGGISERRAAVRLAGRRRRRRRRAVRPRRRSGRPAAAGGAAGEWRSARELLDRVSQFLRDHALQQEPPLRRRRVRAGASDQACARRATR